MQHANAARIQGRAQYEVGVLVEIMQSQLSGLDLCLPDDRLGLFVGPTIHDLAEDFPAQLPPSIYLFQRNLERMARDEEHLAEEIRITLFHEIGHLLGLDESGVAELGLA